MCSSHNPQPGLSSQQGTDVYRGLGTCLQGLDQSKIQVLRTPHLSCNSDLGSLGVVSGDWPLYVRSGPAWTCKGLMTGKRNERCAGYVSLRNKSIKRSFFFLLNKARGGEDVDETRYEGRGLVFGQVLKRCWKVPTLLALLLFQQ